MSTRMGPTDLDLLTRQAYWDKGDMDAIFREVDRARSEEARLLEENREQAEQVSALADALEAERSLSGVHGCQCRDTYVCVTCRGTAALLLVGRIKSAP